MALSAETIDAMVASGCTAEQIAAVVKADLVAQERAKQEKRAKDAERQRRHRERNGASRDVTVTDVTPRDDCDADSPLPPCPPAFPPDPHTTPLNPPIPNPHQGANAKPHGTGPPKRGARLPPDWQPSDADREFARKEGLTDAETDRESAKFRDYWVAKRGEGGVKLDWPATWRNWIRRAVDDGRAGTSGGAGRGGAAGRSEGGGRQPASRVAAYASAAHKLGDQF